MRTWAVALALALAFSAVRFDTIDQLPVWDGAMGMTPAAITLESSDFDIAGLLSMPDYREGGPNLHSLSIATWFVAGAIRLFGSYGAALPFLHIVSFALVGLIGAGVFRIVRNVTTSTPLAVIGALASVIYPPMVVQASDVYLDLPLAAAITWSFVFAFEHKLPASIGLMAVAAAVKPSAIIAVPALAIYFYQVYDSPFRAMRWLGLPTLVALIPWMVDSALRAEADSVPAEAFESFAVTMAYLSKMPILAGVLVFLAAIPVWAGLTGRLADIDQETRGIMVASVVYPISFLGFFLLNPLVTKGVTGLPRYTTMFLPLAVVGVTVGVAAIGNTRRAMAACGVIVLIFSLNMYGDLEPGSENSFWLAERSLAYENYLSLQRESFDSFTEKASRYASFYDHFSHYRISFPSEGWLEEPVRAGTNLSLVSGFSGNMIDELPDEFVILVESPCCGGPELEALLLTALRRPDYAVDANRYVLGEFQSIVAVIKRSNAPTGGTSGA